MLSHLLPLQNPPCNGRVTEAVAVVSLLIGSFLDQGSGPFLCKATWDLGRLLRNRDTKLSSDHIGTVLQTSYLIYGLSRILRLQSAPPN